MNAPVFPLANVVLFPHTFLPLHVFEPRYRAMVAHALEGSRLIVVVLAREELPPGPPPDIHPIGSVGRIDVAKRLEDGRFHLVLHGLSRVALGDLDPRPDDYYEVRLRLKGEMLPDLQDPRVAEAKAAFLMTVRRYAEQVLSGAIPNDLLTEALPYPVLVNRAAALLRVRVQAKQALLEIDDVETRAGEVEGWMERQIASHASIDQFRRHRPSDPSVN
jgi:hypothetical protein